MSETLDRAEKEEARLMSLISGTKPKPVVIKTTPVETPVSPRTQANHSARSQFYGQSASAVSPRTQPEVVNRTPEVVNRAPEHHAEKSSSAVVVEPDLK